MGGSVEERGADEKRKRRRVGAVRRGRIAPPNEAKRFPHNGNGFPVFFHTMEACFAAVFHGVEKFGLDGRGRDGG